MPGSGQPAPAGFLCPDGPDAACWHYGIIRPDGPPRRGPAHFYLGSTPAIGQLARPALRAGRRKLSAAGVVGTAVRRRGPAAACGTGPRRGTLRTALPASFIAPRQR